MRAQRTVSCCCLIAALLGSLVGVCEQPQAAAVKSAALADEATGRLEPGRYVEAEAFYRSRAPRSTSIVKQR